MANEHRPRSETKLDFIRILSLMLFGDFAYAVLPILVLAIITALLSEGYEHFLQIKEWSFATIVMLGVAIRKTIRLKVEVQRITHSYLYTLDTAVQACILFLIGSVLVLSLVIFVEKGVLPAHHAQVLGFVQLSLFLVAVLVLCTTVLAEELSDARESELPDGITKLWFLERIGFQVRRAAECMNYVTYAVVERAPGMRFSEPQSQKARAKYDEATRMARTRAELERLGELVAAARKGIDSMGGG